MKPILKYAALSSEAYIMGTNVNIRKQPTTKEDNIAFQVKQINSRKSDQLNKVKVLTTVSNENEIWHQSSGYNLAKEKGYNVTTKYWVYPYTLELKTPKNHSF